MVKTRFAPSPTGYLHIGGARTALFSWLHARHHQGEFVLRIEDTDRERSTAEAVEVITRGLAWLGLEHDGAALYQSQRTRHYRRAIERLLDTGHAYHCYCSREDLEAMRAEALRAGRKPRYDGRCRDAKPRETGRAPVVRFKNPHSGAVVVDDLVQGRVEFSNTELDDLVIARSDGSPTYNLTVVVDDADLGITHVIRGDDHLNNTPRQINIFRALGQPPPSYAHLPLILDADGKKLSKREDAASVLQYRQQGYLPEALLNYLARLGWSHGDQEIFSISELVALFDITRVNKAAAALNPDKLAWLNQRYLRHSAAARIAPLLGEQLASLGIDVQEPPALLELAEVQQQRVSTVAEMAEQSRFFFQEPLAYDAAAVDKHLRPAALDLLRPVRDALSGLGDWRASTIHAALDDCAQRQAVKFGKLAQPLRVAVTGGRVSPSIDLTLQLLGKNKVLARLAHFLG